MSVFPRKNALNVTVTFTAADGSATQPTSAFVNLTYADLAGLSHTANLPLTYNATPNNWTGSWDSSAAGNCTVYWTAYGTGPIEASAQGAFEVIANPSNTV